MLGQFILREDQVRTIERARAEVARLIARGEPPRVLVVAPCGAGKTVMSSALIAGARGKERTAIFLASGRQLIYQKSRTLVRAGVEHAILMAGEDEHYAPSPVLVASKDTYGARVGRWKMERETRDLWIVDEAHRSTGGEWMDVLPQDDRTVVIGFTATPALADGRGMGGYYRGLVQAATYSELIGDGLLVPCRVFAPWSVDTRNLKRGADGDWQASQLQERFSRKALVGGIVETWLEHGERRPTACFAQGVEHSIGLAHEFRRAGITAAHIDADTPQTEREAAYAGLRDGSIKVVTNFGVLTTGWDEPCVSCGILAFATDSLIKYLQVAGRVLRTAPNKADALLIDHGDNVRRHLWPTEDREWSLDPEEKVQEREARKLATGGKKQPLACAKCGAVREAGPKCPQCGYQRTRAGAMVFNEAGKLVEIRPKQVKQRSEKDNEAKFWLTCLGVMAWRGRNFYAAKAMFRNRIGHEPRGLVPMPEEHKLGLPVGAVFPGFVKRKVKTA